jgi:CTP synthase
MAKKLAYIFVSGGVISGLGKGVLTASIGKLLQAHGFSVSAIKIDPYLNLDAGTMRPTEHGEVWVTEDGGEFDQDLGNYERFLDIPLSKKHNITSGKVLFPVLERERKGEYLGQTVQYIPHVTKEITKQILGVTKNQKVDFVLVEIGGVVGDYENVLFLKAAQQIDDDFPTMYVEVAYLLTPSHLGEMKTKPMQHAIAELGHLGIRPDIVIGRGKDMMDDPRKKKIVDSTGIHFDRIFSAPDIENVYELPIILKKQRLDKIILNFFGLKSRVKNPSSKWGAYVNKISRLKKEVKVGIVGKYFDIGKFTLLDSYISVIEAIKHAAWNNNRCPKIVWIDSKSFEKNAGELKELDDMDCVVVPGGFGKSGIEGKIRAVQYCRENKVPYLGLCLGLQMAVIEFARNVCGLKGAHSTEFAPNTKYPVVAIIKEQNRILEKKGYGGTMRLGAWPAYLKARSLIKKLYGGKRIVCERHRHRYEVNPKYIKRLEKKGLIFPGYSPDRVLMEYIELPQEIHPYFVATQAHPEFTSRPMRPNPLFDGLIKAAIKNQKSKP